MLDNPNVNNRTVQRFAGHSSILTTQALYNYERKSLDEQAAAIDKALEIYSKRHKYFFFTSALKYDIIGSEVQYEYPNPFV